MEDRLRFAAYGENWTAVIREIMLGIGGHNPGVQDSRLDYEEYVEDPWQNIRQEMINAADNRGSYRSLRMLGDDEADVAFCSTTALVNMAKQGIGLYQNPHDISVLARLPHFDWISFAVPADSEIESIAQIAEEQMAVDICRRPNTGESLRNITSFLIDEVFKLYRLSDQRIEKWGGSVTLGGRNRADRMIAGDFDLMIDEAMMTPDWKLMSEEMDLRFLPVEDDVLDYLEELYQSEPEVMPAGYLRGVDEPVPSVGKSGWMIACRSDLSNEATYEIISALDERKHLIEDYFEYKSSRDDYTNPPLTGPIDMSEIWRDTGVDLHPGAAAYYEEHGYK